MNIFEHLDKDNLHHAYLTEGARSEVVPELIKFLKNSGVNTTGNPDFIQISIDSFKIDEAFDLRAMSSNKGFSADKKIFLICANSFSLDAQNVLLKMFEEPIENTHFFVVVPDAKSLLKTLVSRFYFIFRTPGVGEERKTAENFIAMSLKNRIDFIKELLTEEEDESIATPARAGGDSGRSKALKFLNMLEAVLHNKMSHKISDTKIFEHLFKVREFLRMPGSSTKTLMESVALIIPSMLQ